MKRIILCTALSLTTFSAAFAQTTPTAEVSPALHRIEQRLHITEVQREQIKAVLQQERAALMNLRSQREAEHAEMAQLTTFDEARARGIAAKYAQADADAVVEREKLRSEIFAILTPAQQQRLQQLRARLSAALDRRLPTLGDNL